MQRINVDLYLGRKCVSVAWQGFFFAIPSFRSNSLFQKGMCAYTSSTYWAFSSIYKLVR